MAAGLSEGPGAELPAWPLQPRETAEQGRGAADAASLLVSASLKERRALLPGISGSEAGFSRRRPRQQIARPRKRVFGPSSFYRLGRSRLDTRGGGGDCRSAGCSAVWGQDGAGVFSNGPSGLLGTRITQKRPPRPEGTSTYLELRVFFFFSSSSGVWGTLSRQSLVTLPINAMKLAPLVSIHPQGLGFTTAATPTPAASCWRLVPS